jgi:hypothetical protein
MEDDHLSPTVQIAALRYQIDRIILGAETCSQTRAMAIREALSRARPSIPFDLEPNRINPPMIYTTIEVDRRNALHTQYDCLRLWHETFALLPRLYATLNRIT